MACRQHRLLDSELLESGLFMVVIFRGYQLINTRSTLAGINSLQCHTLMARIKFRMPICHSTLRLMAFLPALAVGSSALKIPRNQLTDGFLGCNLGHIYGNLTAVAMSTAGSLCSTGGDVTTLCACECCEFSWPISK